jgi:hypothetical protein
MMLSSPSEIAMGSNSPRRRFRYDWKKGGTYGTTKANPPPLWLILVVSLALAILVFISWLSGALPVGA